MRENDLATLVGGIAVLVCSLAAYIIWIDSRRRTLLSQRKMELHGRVLDKFGSAQELTEFLQTEGGRRFLDATPTEQSGPKERILSSVRRGVILVLLGVALAGIGAVGGDEPPVVIGAIVLALGVGFLISAAVAFRLSKAWGMIDGEPK
ncbi:MAG: hypothetical protein ACRD96_29715 [Bryobacteraceae bacterium]